MLWGHGIRLGIFSHWVAQNPTMVSMGEGKGKTGQSRGVGTDLCSSHVALEKGHIRNAVQERVYSVGTGCNRHSAGG